MSFFNINYNFMHTNNSYCNHFNKTHTHYHKKEQIMHKGYDYDTKIYDEKEYYKEDDSKFSMKDLAELLNGLMGLLKSIIDTSGKEKSSEKQSADDIKTTDDVTDTNNNPFAKQSLDDNDDVIDDTKNQDKKSYTDINPYQVKVSTNGGDRTISYPTIAPDGSNYANGKKLSQIPSQNVQYDSNNKIISEDKIYYVYQSQNKDLSNGYPVQYKVHFEYQYDNNGNLIKRTIVKTIVSGGDENFVNTVEETYDPNSKDTQTPIVSRKETTTNNDYTESITYARNDDGSWTRTGTNNLNGKTTTSTEILRDGPNSRFLRPTPEDQDYYV